MAERPPSVPGGKPFSISEISVSRRPWQNTGAGTLRGPLPAKDTKGANSEIVPKDEFVQYSETRAFPLSNAIG